MIDYLELHMEFQLGDSWVSWEAKSWLEEDVVSNKGHKFMQVVEDGMYVFMSL